MTTAIPIVCDILTTLTLLGSLYNPAILYIGWCIYAKCKLVLMEGKWKEKDSLNKAIWRNLSSGVAVLVSFSWSKFPLPYKGERYLCTCMQEKQEDNTCTYVLYTCTCARAHRLRVFCTTILRNSIMKNTVTLLRYRYYNSLPRLVPSTFYCVLGGKM